MPELTKKLAELDERWVAGTPEHDKWQDDAQRLLHYIVTHCLCDEIEAEQISWTPDSEKRADSFKCYRECVTLRFDVARGPVFMLYTQPLKRVPDAMPGEYWMSGEIILLEKTSRQHHLITRARDVSWWIQAAGYGKAQPLTKQAFRNALASLF